jgi:hypothetical protein
VPLVQLARNPLAIKIAVADVANLISTSLPFFSRSGKTQGRGEIKSLEQRGPLNLGFACNFSDANRQPKPC